MPPRPPAGGSWSSSRAWDWRFSSSRSRSCSASRSSSGIRSTPSRSCSPAFSSSPASVQARLIGSPASSAAGRLSRLPWPGSSSSAGSTSGSCPGSSKRRRAGRPQRDSRLRSRCSGPSASFWGCRSRSGLKALGAGAPALVPWAWGINACASVVSASLATFIALHIGFTPVLGCALVLYVLAAAFPPRAAAVSR